MALLTTRIGPKNRESAKKYLFVLPAFRATMARHSGLIFSRSPSRDRYPFETTR